MKGLLALALIFVSSGLGGARQAKPTLDSLAWIAGAWAGDAGGVEMEEHWTTPKGNSMIGLHRDVAKGRTVGFEFMRIEQQADPARLLFRESQPITVAVSRADVARMVRVRFELVPQPKDEVIDRSSKRCI